MTAAIEFGNQVEALAWIESAEMTDDERYDLRVFIQRFPHLEYYRFVRAIGPKISQWLVDLRSGLGGFDLHKMCFVKYEGISLQPDKGESQEEVLYNWDFSNVLSAEFRKVYLEDDQLLIVGAWLYNLSSVLAIKMHHPNDKRVYEFAYGSVKLDQSKSKVGNLSMEDVRVILPSYSNLFTHITKIVSRQDGESDTIHLSQMSVE